ncbi:MULTISPECIES: ATP-binding cassette domain-containing protein [Corynebacterium]|uniref:ABC transport system, ATP-binding protein n=1 Tax=Corynebacterium minutissimum TaxID=38301 RepID=A0A2X4RR47_9CORY|nr:MULTISPECIES: ATP-binding cassette domain-containing protein [Corynebacterium]KHO28592.1 ABC transporter ATP-binding protein [Corynebacterium minutissimum]MCG7228758.1 ATP-binding cassette domain-containing protein [Corynebacterium minutissimum]MCG7237875.1 ATP-binding cassette domain-containing protein [Corynebacterium minutissimum]QPS59561.1 sugar ABC transporter ATP-binding protein [Corynebacterium minutissimum]QQA79649.1 sugar ABC transporter ATP-binding protein [Corynebacterium minutis
MIELHDISQTFGNFHALRGINLTVQEGAVTCVLGDNGAGKSTLIKILAGLNQPTGGTITVDGDEVRFDSPRDSLDAGIATVYQDLALVPSLSVWRNFFLGQELTGALGRLREEEMKRITHDQLAEMGIVLGDVSVELSALSGGQRQVVAIARAIYFGARYIILDEPTAALGVKQSGMVLRFINAARERGMGVVFITHNPQHAYLVGDHFVVLTVGEMSLDAAKADVTLPELTQWMAGGDELEELKQELAR